MSSGWIFPQQRYGCIQCGKSCGGWRIWVEPELLETLQRHPLALEQPVVQTDAQGAHSLRYDEHGRCRFVRSDQLCALHADLGWSSKPRACRQFPFFLVDTPDGFHVGLSFRCSAVQQNRGVEWSEHVPDLEQLLAGAHYPRVGYEPARLGPTELSWDEYGEWERNWLAALAEGEELAPAVWADLQPRLGLLLDRSSFDSLVKSLAASAVGYLEGDPGIATAVSSGLAYQSPRRGGMPHRGAEPPSENTVRGGRSRRGAEPPSENTSIGLVPAVVEPWPAADEETRRYLYHALERKTLWWGPNFLGSLLMLLVAEKLLGYYGQLLGPAAAFDLVEGEWVSHTDQTDVAEGFASVLLQFC